MKRLPSFNDFSPAIIKDVRLPLRVVKDLGPDFDAVVSEWDRLFFDSASNKRARTNVSATLSNTGLIDRKAVALTEVGEWILRGADAKTAAARFCKHVVDHMNGMAVISAVKALNARSEPITKTSLKRELETFGITNLSNATTDHTTLRNWMTEAGILGGKQENYSVNEDTMKSVLGVSSEELTEIESLTTPQRIFLETFRRLAELSPADPVPAKLVIDECLRDYEPYFDESQLRKNVIAPLEEAGWLTVARLSGGRGAKSGTVTATKKLLGVPIEQVVVDFDAVVPPDLRAKISTPPSEILKGLNSSKKYDRGLALELLALRMILDLGLEPRAFRLRSKQTAYAELDLIAEGKNLLFSRWNFQCKCVKGVVSLGDVAKEVGLAIYTNAHVIAMVTTSTFSAEARKYAKEIALASHLQFLFVDGKIVQGYLEKGSGILLAHVIENAGDVMQLKRQQSIIPGGD